MSKGLIIPTPEVTSLADDEAYDKIYPADYKLPRQLIHMQRKSINYPESSFESDTILFYKLSVDNQNWLNA